MNNSKNIGFLLAVLLLGWVLGSIAPIRVVENPHYQSKPVEAIY